MYTKTITWLGIWAIILIIWLVYMITMQDRILSKATTDCRAKWWYTETIDRMSEVLCWNQKWDMIYFRRSLLDLSPSTDKNE